MLYSKKMCWGPRSIRQALCCPMVPQHLTERGSPPSSKAWGWTPQSSLHIAVAESPQNRTVQGCAPYDGNTERRSAEMHWSTNRQCSTHSTGGSGCNSAESGVKRGVGLGRTMSCRTEQRRAKQMRGAYAEGQSGGVRGAGLPAEVREAEPPHTAPVPRRAGPR